MKQPYVIMVWMMLLLSSVSSWAYDVVSESDTLRTDSISEPEWYVAPLVREADFAPRRAAAANCPVDSVLTFNVDSVLVEVTMYEYGDTTRTMVWTVNADGSRIGKSRTESASTATTSYSATYAWDANTNNWKGTSKEEHTYAGTKETERILYNTWLNNDWLADTKYTWAYDAAGRESEYTTYSRNTTTNELVLSQQRIREWYNNSKLTLEIQYTAHNGTAWSAGTKKEYAYDASGNQIEYTYYSSLSNGNWVGSTHEKWTYTSGKKTYYEKQTWSNGGWVNDTKEVWEFNTAGKQTLHEKYNGSNSTWTLALQENSGYDEAGNNILIENYSLTNNVWTGTKKEEYTFNAAKKKTSTVIYQWTNGAWVGKSKELWAFNAANKQTLHEKYSWSNGDWSLTLQENSGYDAAGNNDLIENYNVSNGTFTGTKKEEYTFKGTKKTVVIKYKWSNGAFIYNTKAVTDVDDAGNSIETANYNWSNDAWVGTGTRTLQTFNSNKKVTEKITQSWPTGSADWVNKTCTTTVYSGANKTQELYSNWSNDAWVASKRTDYHYNASNKNDTTTSYTYSDNEWKYANRTVNTFNANGTNIMTHNAKWQDNAWVMTSMTRTDISDMTVDGIRQTLYAQWQCGADSVWKGIQKDTSSYTSSGKKIMEAHYTSWANNDWVPSYRIEYKYDEAGRDTLNQRYDWINNSWQGHYRYEHRYDAQGRELMNATYSNWNTTTSSWKGTTKYEYGYDNNGRKVSQISYTWSERGWEYLFSYNYVYDASGHEVLETIQRYKNEDWVNTNKYEKEYLGSQMVKDNSYYWLNGKWQFTQRNEKYYDHDAQSKLRREITGSWNTSGIVSSYTDNLYSYSCDPKYYTIRFVNYDGTELSSESIVEGETPSYNGEEPTKQEDAEFSYSFAGWTPSVVPVTGNATYTATYTATKRSYTITWLNEDGTEISHETLEYGATPAHANINKESTAEFTYTFAGWTPGIGIVTGDATYTAQFSATKNSYYIIWLNDDNTEIDRTLVEYGVVPTHTAPTKEATDEHSYFFDKWTPDVVAVTGEATYKATYTETTKVYTITWLNEDGTEISYESLEYGATPSHTALTKDATAEYTYTFAGWNPAVTSVTGDATYTATFTATKRSYTITWLNEDGSEIEHETLEYGATPVHADVTKENTAEFTYAFTGWTPAIVDVTGDATYKATFSQTKNSYTITWLNEDGTEISHETLEYGVLPTHDDVTKQRTAEWTYSFIGWSPDIQSVTGDAAYTAQFNATKNSYYITWLNSDNSQLDQTLVEYGVVPTHTAPTKEATDEHSYFFAGWMPEVVAVTGEATYKATYTETTKVYTITWLNEDGTEISYESLEYGATPSHTALTKDATAEYTYTFAGWNPAVTSVTGDATYTATFTATKRSYTITWLNEDGSEIEHETLEYGATPVHADVTKENTAEFTYAFTGWTPAIVDVTGDATYKATFSQTKNSYTITWLNEDGTEISHETMEYGATPSHADINKESTAEFTYAFAGWTPAIVDVVGNASYQATFSATKNSYTITWLNEDGSEIEHETLEYGATPSHADVTKENTAEFTYIFTGWTPQIATVSGNASYTASFTATKNKYTIMFLNYDGTELQSSEVEYGIIPNYEGATPTKPADAQDTYTFAGWDETIVAVTGDKTYTAQFSSEVNSYTITWLDEDNSSLGTSTLEYGVVPTHEDPTKQPTAQYGYTFAGWSPAISAVTGNATYKATYTDTINQYTILWLDDTGTLVDQTKVAYGVTPAHANIYKESDDQYDYTFVGWTPTLVPVTGDASYAAIFTTAGKSYTVTFYFEDGVTVLDQMTLPYGAIPSTPYIPSIPSDANHTYTFSGWSPEIAPVTGDISYVPTFTAIPNQYTVIFRNYNGKELQRKKVDYGTIPEYEGDEPSRPATNSYTWAFEGWTPELTAVIGDATYTAVYSKVMNTYTILFYDEDGTTLLDEVTVEHGQKPTTSVIPTKEADEEYRYTFAGWSPKIAKATSDAEYIATYLATPKTQGLGDVQRDDVRCTKVLLDGTIYIRRGGNTYSIDGQRVK